MLSTGFSTQTAIMLLNEEHAMLVPVDFFIFALFKVLVNARNTVNVIFF